MEGLITLLTRKNYNKKILMQFMNKNNNTEKIFIAGGSEWLGEQ